MKVALLFSGMGGQMKERFFNLQRIRVIIALAFFNFIFLGTEYLFNDMMAYVTDSKEVVIAQSYVLGASVIGFLLFSIFNRFAGENVKQILVFVASIVSIICIFIIQQHVSYEAILLSGLVVFILLGIAGSAVHYMAACVLENDKNLARTVGLAYAVGLLFQFINNNLVNNDTIESIILSVFLTIFIILLVRLNHDAVLEEKKNMLPHPVVTGGILVMIVILMTCIFATLDNVVTLFHAAGSMDIGQWPRLLLALSGLIAGVLFDLKERHYMNIIMYCVTLLSTICVLVIVSGGPFLIGLIVFYLSAGFFVVFFTTGFMELSYRMKVPELWAGLGRAVNNICAGIIGTWSLSLIESGNSVLISIIAFVLFALISVAIFLYSNQFRSNTERKEGSENEKTEENIEKFSRFSKAFSLTTREEDVLKMLLTSDDNVQEIAAQLFISRAALYRHIASLNEKTATKSRIGLLQFYYAWEETGE